MIEEDEEIQEITYNLEEHEEYKMSDMILLWNVQKLNLKSDGFPMPAIDNVNFEHSISLSKLGYENGYLVNVNEALVKYIKRTEEDLVYYIAYGIGKHWDIIKITQNPREKKGKPVMSLYQTVADPVL